MAVPSGMLDIISTCGNNPDGRLIPFDTFNLFYRDDLETTRLAPLRGLV